MMNKVMKISGEELGVMASDDIPEFVIELGKAVTESGMDYEKFASEKEKRF